MSTPLLEQKRRTSMSFVGGQLEAQAWYWLSDPENVYIPAKFVAYSQGQQGAESECLFELFGAGSATPPLAVPKSRCVGRIVDEWHLTDIHKDLVKNDDVSEPNILWSLRQRYARDEIYASIGSILIALNPYKSIASLYSATKMEEYLGTSSAVTGEEERDPHIWLIAQNAFNQLRGARGAQQRRQAIVISGESGAGKTEATKKCLQYLSFVASGSTSTSSSSSSSSSSCSISDQVLKTNPLLESFGNSKTARNNNSSRFGKWLEIIFRSNSSTNNNSSSGGFFFDTEGLELTLVGASITQYLLEKSRVVVQAPLERNYHIFYQICADPTMLCLPAKDFLFLNQSGCVHIDGVDDADDFRETAASFEQLQFSVHDQIAIFSALRAILYLGNVVFLDGGSAHIQIEGGEGCLALTTAALALGLPPQRLAECLTTRTFLVRGEKHVCEYTVSQAVDARNALAKEVYGRLFAQVVAKSNQTLSPPGAPAPAAASSSSDLAIGCLDIFGFEIFEHNSFEQLSINYGNEKLQQYFVRFVLKEEQRIYEAEGIPYERLNPQDNEDVLALMEARPLGVFCRLDEELKINEGSDLKLLQKLERDHNSKQPTARFFRDHKMPAAHFEIRHFAGTVRYDCLGFMDKNRDKLHDHLEELISEVGTDGAHNSALVLLRQILLTHGPSRDASSSSATASSVSPGPRAGGKVTTTLATRFQSQLSQLMAVLDQSNPHFVRCIKPNNSKSPDLLDAALTLQQLRYSGVLEAIQIRKGGYPVRRTHREFRQRYWYLTGLFRKALDGLSDQQMCLAVVRELGQRSAAYAGIQVGRTLVFFKTEVLASLEKERALAGRRALACLQRVSRGFPKRLHFALLRAKYRQLQELAKLGRLQRESNVSVLSPLRAALLEARALGMVSSLLREAQRLQGRLEQVEACVAKMAALIAALGRADILDEYRAICALVEEEAPLGIDCPEIVELKRQLVAVKDRAEVVAELRRALADRDEDGLKASLSRVSQLAGRYGPFCAADEERAKELRAKMEMELMVLDAAVRELGAFQTVYRTALPASDASVLGLGLPDERWPWFAERVESTNEALLAMLEQFAADPPVAPAARLLIQTFQTLVEMQRAWASREWELVSLLLQDVFRQSAAVEALETPAAQSLRSRAEAVRGLVETHTSFVRRDLERFVLIPLLREGLQKGRIAGGEADAGLALVDFQCLLASVDRVRAFEWCGPTVVSLVGRSEVLARVRKAFAEQRWDDALRLTEGPEQGQARGARQAALGREMRQFASRKSRRCSSFVGFLNVTASAGGGGEGESDDVVISITAATAENDRIAALTRGVTVLGSKAARALAEPMGGEVRTMAEAIEDELGVARRDAFNRMAQVGMEEALLLGAAEGQCGEVDAEAVTAVPLRTIMREIDAQLAEEEAPHVDMDQGSLSLRLRLEMLAGLRERFAAGEALGTAADKEAMQALSAQVEARTQTHYVGYCLRLCRDEASLLLAESASRVSVDSLTRAVVGSCIQGRVGQLVASRALLEGLEAEVAAVGGQAVVSRRLHELAALSKALVRMRRSFLEADGAAEDLAAVRLLVEPPASTLSELPSEVSAELVLLARHAEYSSCVATLRAALQAPPVPTGVVAGPWPRPYLVPLPSTRAENPRASIYDGHINREAAFEREIAAILRQDGLALNEPALSTKALSHALAAAEALDEQLEHDAELPEEFGQLVRGCFLVKCLRDFVKNHQWVDATDIIAAAEGEGVPAQVPLLAAEVRLARQHAASYTVVSLILKAWKERASAFLDGFVVFHETDALEGVFRAIDKYRLNEPVNDEAEAKDEGEGNGEGGAPRLSQRARDMMAAAALVLQLRRAQNVHDRESIRAALNSAAERDFGHGTTAFCLEELSRARAELDTFDTIDRLQGAIVGEAVRTLPDSCFMDLKSARVEALSAALALAQAIDSSRRSRMLGCVTALAELVAEARQAAIHKDWDALRRHLPLWKDAFVAFDAAIKTLHNFAASAGSTSKTSQAYVAATLAALIEQQFRALIAAMTREINVMVRHLSVLDLQTGLMAALGRDGMAQQTTGQLVVAQVSPEPLTRLLVKRIELEESLLVETLGEAEVVMPLPADLVALFAVAQVVRDLRAAVVTGRWDSVQAAVRDLSDPQHALSSLVPACTQAELAACQHELDNRLITQNFTAALETGGMQGRPDRPELDCVRTDALARILQAHRATPLRTQEARKLVRTAQLLLPLRRLLCDTPVQWALVLEAAESLLSLPPAELLVTAAHEIDFVAAAARDALVVAELQHALATHGPRGQPGALDLSSVSVSALDEALRKALSLQPSEAIAALMTAAKTLRHLRHCLLQTRGDESVAFEAWESIRAAITRLFEQRRAQLAVQPDGSAPPPIPHDSWPLCLPEVMLVAKESRLAELKVQFEASVEAARPVYSRRRNRSLVHTLRDDALRSVIVGPDLNAAGTQGGAEVWADGQLSVSDMNVLLDRASVLDFACPALEYIVSAAWHVRELRCCVLEGDWARLRASVEDGEVLAVMQRGPRGAQEELASLQGEAGSRFVLGILGAALAEMQPLPLDINVAPSAELSLPAFGPSPLEGALRTVRAALPSLQRRGVALSAASEQLLECAEQTWELRRSLGPDPSQPHGRDREATTRALRWFQAHALECPPSVQLEVQHVYVVHQNDLLDAALRAALASSPLQGECGFLDGASIDTDGLAALLQQASGIHPRLERVERLFRGCEAALALRGCLKRGDFSSLRRVLGGLEAPGSLHAYPPEVLREVEFARNELDNWEVVAVMLAALGSFDAGHGGSHGHGPGQGYGSMHGLGESLSHGSAHSAHSPQPAHPSSRDKLRYRYSMYNSTRHAAIDVDSVDAEVIQEALVRVAGGRFQAARARRLRDTCVLVRDVRAAIKCDDWMRVAALMEAVTWRGEGLPPAPGPGAAATREGGATAWPPAVPGLVPSPGLGDLTFDVQHRLDCAAEAELASVARQLEMRAAVLGLVQALQRGQAVWRVPGHRGRMAREDDESESDNDDEGEDRVGAVMDLSLLEVHALREAIARAQDSAALFTPPELRPAPVAAPAAKPKPAPSPVLSPRPTRSSTLYSLATKSYDKKADSRARPAPATPSTPSAPRRPSATPPAPAPPDGDREAERERPEKSAVQLQVETLLRSARDVLQMRELLAAGRAQAAGLAAEALVAAAEHYRTSLADDRSDGAGSGTGSGSSSRLLGGFSHPLGGAGAMTTGTHFRENKMPSALSIHPACQREVALYAAEILRPLRELRLCASLSRACREGDMRQTAVLLSRCWDQGLHSSPDLGQALVLHAALGEMDAYREGCRALRHVRGEHDVEAVEALLREGVRQRAPTPLLDAARQHLARLLELEGFASAAKRSYCGALSDADLERFVTLGGQLSLRAHPLVKDAAAMLALSPAARRAARMALACADNLPALAATQSLPLRRAALSAPASRRRHALENFAGLRSPRDAEQGTRSPIAANAFGADEAGPDGLLDEATWVFRRGLLAHAETLPHPLTRLAPELGDAALLLFGLVRAIETGGKARGLAASAFEEGPPAPLAALVNAARVCPPLRDEALLQLLKQLRFRRDSDEPLTQQRDCLWRALAGCLANFPPSRGLENYLETFLWAEAEARLPRASAPPSPAAQQCLRLLHETLFSLGNSLEAGRGPSLDALSGPALSALLAFQSPDAYTSALRPRGERLGGGGLSGSLAGGDDPAFPRAPAQSPSQSPAKTSEAAIFNALLSPGPAASPQRSPRAAQAGSMRSPEGR